MPNSILVADPRPALRDELSRELSAQGHQVQTAESAAHAVTLLASAECADTEIVIAGAALDQLVREVRARRPDVEVLVVSDESDRERAGACLSAGASAILRTPWSSLELSHTIDVAAERRWTRTSKVHEQALQAILATVDPERLPEAILDAWLRALSADRARLFVPVEPGSRRLTIAWECGPGKGGAELDELDAWFATATEPLLVGEGPPATSLAASVGRRLYYPFLASGRPLGAVELTRATRPFRAGELARLEVLAECTRAALDRAQILRHLVWAERLASIGRLAKGIAGQLSTPLSWAVENVVYVAAGLQRLRENGGLGKPLESELAALEQAAFDTADGGSRIQQIVRDLGALASADDTTRVAMSLDEVIETALRLTQPELRARINVLRRIEGGIQLVGSASRLSHCFVNLLCDSAERLGDARVSDPTIIISSRTVNQTAVVEISDNAPALPRERQDAIFESFFSAPGSSAARGLGLYLARDIVRRHGGQIRFRSLPRRGNTFTVELPFERPTPARVRETCSTVPADKPV